MFNPRSCMVSFIAPTLNDNDAIFSLYAFNSVRLDDFIYVYR